MVREPPATITQGVLDPPERRGIESSREGGVDGGEGSRSIGPFALRREIGRGASGIVYEGFDAAREIRVAVKEYSLISDQVRAGVPRLHRDAQAAGALGHPNIATVIGVGEQDGCPWVATELVTGVSLAQVARSRAPWPIERVLDVWRQLCEGLAHAHREGLLHLDLKPSDVRLSADGDVKVLDFGSWHLKSLERQGAARADDGLHYRPPEVVAGGRPDRRADIFAVGAIVYEIVARRRAFPGEGTTDVIRSLSRCEPDLATLPSSAFSPGFERLLAASLAREPSGRPASFEEVHADLVQLVRETAPRLREIPAPSRTRPERDHLLAELTQARAEERLEDALDLCRKLLALDPEDEAARRAFPEIESVLVTREADALVGEALTLAADGDIEAATRLAEKVERLAPWSPRYLQLQVYLDEEGAQRSAASAMKDARTHLASGRAEEARAAAQEVLRLLPGYEEAVRLLEALERLDIPAPEASPPTAEANPGPSLDEALPDVEVEDSNDGGAASAQEAPVPPAAPASPRGAPSRKSQAEELTADALRHFVANEHGQAREAVDRALHLDPVNRRARELQRILRVLG
jgi:serine/threonine protein kinase